MADCYPSRAQGMQADAASQPIRPAFFSPRRLAGLLLLLLLLLRGMSLPRPGSTDIATTRHRALCLACTASVPPDGLPR